MPALHATRGSPGLRPRDGIHARLAAHPTFADAGPTIIRRAVKWGVEAEVAAGVTLLEEDRLGYWFLVILVGAVQLSRAGRELEVRSEGSHVGELAILSLGPQPATVRTIAPTRMLILGRRELRSLCDSPAVRRNLFPDLDPRDFTAHVRRMRAAAEVEWRAIRPPPVTSARPAGALPPSIRVVRNRRTDAVRSSVRNLLGASATTAVPTAIRAASRISPRTRRAIALVVAALVVMIGLTYHPPCYVVRPVAAIDIATDIHVDGTAASPPTGRYLLVPVDLEQPTLAGALVASVRRERVVWWAHLGDTVARQAGRDLFRATQRRALAIVEARLGIDPGRVHVAIDDHDVGGPSGALVYALALCDVLDRRDLAAGRVIAATGELDDRGDVLPVGFVPVKERAARAAGAVVLLVPHGVQTVVMLKPAITAVGSLDEALRALAPAGACSRTT